MNIPYVALKNLKRKISRTVLLFTIVAVVSCTLFSATLFLKSINNALRAGAYRLGADIIVVPESAKDQAQKTLLSGEPAQFLMNRSVLDQVRALTTVKSATPQLFVTSAELACCFKKNMLLVAFDPETDFIVKPWLEMNLKRKLGGNELITGKAVPAIPGDKVPFFGTAFTVAGTMDATGTDFFDHAAFMNLDAAYAMAEASKTKSLQPIEITRDRISTILVQVKDEYAPARTAIRIEHDIKGVKALVSDTIISTVRKQLSSLMKAVVAISIILWSIVLLIMAFAFYMIVNERRREIGLLRAMGANRVHITAIFLSEAGFLSATGGGAGVLLGYGLLIGFKGLMLHYFKLPYLFPSAPELVLMTIGAIVLSLLTGLLAAFLPSLTLLKQEPYEAIRSAE